MKIHFLNFYTIFSTINSFFFYLSINGLSIYREEKILKKLIIIIYETYMIIMNYL